MIRLLWRVELWVRQRQLTATLAELEGRGTDYNRRVRLAIEARVWREEIRHLQFLLSSSRSPA